MIDELKKASSELWTTVKPYFDRELSDNDWETVIGRVSEIGKKYPDGYAGEYGMCLLNELEREQRKRKNANK